MASHGCITASPDKLGTSVARRPLTPKIMPLGGYLHMHCYRLHLRVSYG
jgi:hypothetical protein